jgi:hypothetical protein
MSYKQLTAADQDDEDMEQDRLISDHEEDDDLEAAVPIGNGGVAASFDAPLN